MGKEKVVIENIEKVLYEKFSSEDQSKLWENFYIKE